ncbi:MAG: RluA family pseudouridine synthase [Actinobacteria bacterium]|nr:RluA family pseudouridine synthase [Actinomycetota bacterium]MBU1492909.1 RluA family pseudouridine synthase [Actinomycetota bacterium]
MRARVPADLDGERADLIVARMAGVSRTVAKQMLAGGDALVDGERAAPRQRLAAGAGLELEAPGPEAPLEAEEVGFAVRYEDAHLAVIDKPAGLVVHPGAGRRTGTLAAGLLHRWPRVEGVGDPGRWGIVHRLDRGTSGLLVVALDAGAYTGLRAAMGRREVTRTYLALVHGSSAAPTGTIDAPLGRDPRHPTRFRVDRSGRPARTHYRRLATWEGAGLALLEVRLETGRTHQIRVHTASIGHPVAGDPAYGRGGDGIPRLCLHAAGLRFTHPVTGGEVAVASPLPTDMADIVRGLGSPTTGEVPYR